MSKVLNDLKGIARIENYPDGSVRDCTLNVENRITTCCGDMTPKFGDMNVRRKNTSAISFYEDGSIKRLALERQTPIETPLGIYPAELVSFYPSGALKRFFPLDGQISGFWSEEDEEKLLDELTFSLPFGTVKAKIIGGFFYESGQLKSLTLWPSQKIEIPTPIGGISVRSGFCLHKNGALKSVEPALPTAIPTPIGIVKAFDSSAIGINADSNSLIFDDQGQIVALTLHSCIVTAVLPDGSRQTIEPAMTLNPLDNESFIEIPVKMAFMQDSVAFDIAGNIRSFCISTTSFSVKSKPRVQSCTGTDCQSCNACPSLG